MMTERDDDQRASKARESRLRRQASRQGLRLVKSRIRDQRAFEYGRYRIIDPEINGVVAGHPLALNLDDVERELARLAERG